LAAFFAALARRTLRRSFNSAARSDFLVLLGIVFPRLHLAAGGGNAMIDGTMTKKTKPTAKPASRNPIGFLPLGHSNRGMPKR
jgi:hypothetical protein